MRAGTDGSAALEFRARRPHTAGMTTAALVAILLFGAAMLIWSANRGAAEIALRHGREACAAAGVQWLDQSVQLAALRLRRGRDGWLRLERRYRFDYSRDGIDRHRGHIVLLGGELQELAGPAPAPTLH